MLPERLDCGLQGCGARPGAAGLLEAEVHSLQCRGAGGEFPPSAPLRPGGSSGARCGEGIVTGSALAPAGETPLILSLGLQLCRQPRTRCCCNRASRLRAGSWGILPVHLPPRPESSAQGTCREPWVSSVSTNRQNPCGPGPAAAGSAAVSGGCGEIPQDTPEPLIPCPRAGTPGNCSSGSAGLCQPWAHPSRGAPNPRSPWSLQGRG